LAKDLRTFLDALKDKGPEWFVRVSKEVDPRLEPVAFMRKLELQGYYPTVLFERVRGSDIPVVSWVAPEKKQLAVAFDTDEEGLVAEFIRREKNLIPENRLETAPVQDVVLTEGDARLDRLPIVTSCEKDSGPYITLGVLMVRDPETGMRNMGIYRHLVHDDRLLSVGGPEPHSRLGYIYRQAEQQNKPLEAAIFIGHHPACILASQCKQWVDEIDLAGGLMDEPLETVACKTIDLEVPANAEIVIEGKIPPGTRRTDGPFAEFTRYYGEPYESALFEVTAITHREDAMYHHCNPMFPEHNTWGILPREANFLRRITAACPTVKDVRLPLGGCARFMVYVQISKGYDGAGKVAAMAALAADQFLKIVIVVDEDVNIHDDDEVLWAVSTRTQFDRSLFQVPMAPASLLDPSNYSLDSRVGGGSLNTKLAIDATKPVHAPFHERVFVPEETLNAIRIEDYIEGWGG